MKYDANKDPYNGVFGYNEPLDSPNIDPNPHFRQVLCMLTETGMRTVSSCQGHKALQNGHPYTNTPYITYFVSIEMKNTSIKIMKSLGAIVSKSADKDPTKILAKFPANTNWEHILLKLKEIVND
jgi:hypothetical protein